MKTNKQILKLMENGFRPSTLQNLTDGQINLLYNRIVESSKENNEAVEKTIKQITFDPSSATDIGDLAKKGIKVDPTTKKITLIQGKEKSKKGKVIQDGEMKEDDTVEKDPFELTSTQDKRQVGPSDYGNNPKVDKEMDADDADGMGESISEARKKKSKAKNPWAICTSTMGKEFGTTERSDWTKKQMNKYERCVMDVKKSMKEGKNPFEVILERQILSLMEKELYPRMTKAELMKTISEKKKEIVVIDEAEPAPAPTKPDVKPDTRPARRRRPGQVPGPDPAPKAKSSEEKKDKYMDMISKILRNEK